MPTFKQGCGSGFSCRFDPVFFFFPTRPDHGNLKPDPLSQFKADLIGQICLHRGPQSHQKPAVRKQWFNGSGENQTTGQTK